MSRSVGVDDIFQLSVRQGPRVCSFCGRRISGFGSPRSLLACHVLLGEPLLPRFALPIIISHTSAINDHPTAELSEHRLRSHDCYLTRAVRIRKYLLMYQIIFLRLTGDDLVQRPILVEEQVGISVIQNSRALCCEHEQLVAPVWNEKGPTLVFASIERMSRGRGLLLARLVVLSRYVLVAFRSELIGRVVSDGR